jgi:hypothetical protein
MVVENKYVLVWNILEPDGEEEAEYSLLGHYTLFLLAHSVQVPFLLFLLDATPLQEVEAHCIQDLN